MAKKQNGLYLFPEIEEITEDLTDEQLGQVVRAAFAYRRCGEGYNGKDCMVKLVCRIIFSQIQRGEEVSRQKQAAARARWENAEEMHPDAENMQTDAEEMHKDAESMHTDAEPMHSDAPIQSNPIQSYPIQSYPIHTSPIQSFPKAYVPAGGKAPFGKFDWVKLTKQVYAALDRELGKGELERCSIARLVIPRQPCNRGNPLKYQTNYRTKQSETLGIAPEAFPSVPRAFHALAMTALSAP